MSFRHNAFQPQWIAAGLALSCALSVGLTVPKALQIRATRQRLLEYRRRVLPSGQDQGVPKAEQAARSTHGVARSGGPVSFLQELSRTAALSGVELVGYRAPATAAVGQAPPATGDGLSQAQSETNVTIAGSYRQLQAFFSALPPAQHVCAVKELRVSVEQYPRLSASFRLAYNALPPGGEMRDKDE
jgi:hypothetical protein